MSFDKAIDEIAQDRRTVAAALPTGTVVTDVNIDSKDYFVSSPIRYANALSRRWSARLQGGEPGARPLDDGAASVCRADQLIRQRGALQRRLSRESPFADSSSR